MIKVVFVLIAIVLGIIVLALFGTPARKPERPLAPKPAESLTASPRRAPVPASAPARAEPKGTLAQDIGQTVDYATGYTTLKVKQHSEKKLDAIQQKHNQALSGQAK